MEEVDGICFAWILLAYCAIYHCYATPNDVLGAGGYFLF